MSHSDFTLEDFLPYKLSVTANSVSQVIAKSYAPYNLTRTQWRVMAALSSSDDMTAQLVAIKTGMDKTTISRAVAKLVARGFIERCASTLDGRSAPLSLSQEGSKIFEKIVPEALRLERQIKQALSQSDIDQLSVILDQIKDGN